MGLGQTAYSSHSFRRHHRLLTAGDFNKVFGKAKRSSDRYYTVLYTPGTTAEARIGFAIAKKKVSKAPGRNRLKRVARESFRQTRSSLKPYDIVILANSGAATATNKELFSSLERHWSKLRS